MLPCGVCSASLPHQVLLLIPNNPDASFSDLVPAKGDRTPAPSLLPHPSLYASLGVPELAGLQTGLYLQNRPPPPQL